MAMDYRMRVTTVVQEDAFRDTVLRVCGVSGLGPRSLNEDKNLLGGSRDRLNSLGKA